MQETHHNRTADLLRRARGWCLRLEAIQIPSSLDAKLDQSICYLRY